MINLRLYNDLLAYTSCNNRNEKNINTQINSFFSITKTQTTARMNVCSATTSAVQKDLIKFATTRTDIAQISVFRIPSQNNIIFYTYY